MKSTESTKQKIRPHPTEKYLMELVGNSDLISHIFKGLYDTYFGEHDFYPHGTPLAEIYPYLNLDELFAFGAGSWKAQSSSRKTCAELKQLAKNLTASNVYELFRYLNEQSFGWLVGNRDLSEFSERTKSLHEKLNPFSTEKGSLRSRMVRASKENPEAVDTLLMRLKRSKYDYLPEKDYRAIGGETGSNLNIRPLNFLLTDRKPKEKRTTIVRAYAKELAKMLKHFPQEVKENAKTLLLFGFYF